MHVHQQAHEFGHANRRMGVVELDRRLVGEGVDIAMLSQMAADQILQARRRRRNIPAATAIPDRPGVESLG